MSAVTTTIRQSAAIAKICAELKARLVSRGVVPRDSANPYNGPWFFGLRDEILNGIGDPTIRSLTW